MKKTLACLCLIMTALIASTSSASTNAPRRVLSVGNSFSGNAHKYLKQIADSMNSPLVLGNAVIGGCPLQRHWNNASTNGVCYSYKGEKVTLEQFLKAEKWDVVTIQQASGSSRFPGTYEPFGTQLIAFIKDHAPQAEVVVHETWAYRQDEKRITNWKITTDQMYADVSKTYKDFAAKHGLRVIPAGDAFQLARKTPGWGDYTPADKASGTPAKGKTLQGKDGYHANTAGEYLLGCVWYEFLFGNDVRKSTLIPENLTPEDAAALREIALATTSN